MYRLLNVSKTFKDKENIVNAVNNVSLTIEKGSIHGIIGFSGAGKSTLVRCLNLLEVPDSGKVIFNGKDLMTLKGKELRKSRQKIGMIFQSFNLVTRTTVIRNVLMAKVPEMPFWRVLLGVFKKEDKMQALESLDKVGILDKAYIRADQLSGGQQQRVSIGRAIVKNPDILLCDEPTGALDYNTSKEILKLIENVNVKYGNTVIMVTHNEAIRHMADHVIKLRDGAVRHNDINEHKISAADLEW